MSAQELAERLCKIKVLILDVDGVLTDGRVIYGDYGDELKFFDSQDGLGIELLRRAGIQTVILTGRKSKVNLRRFKELRMTLLLQGVKDKQKEFERLLKRFRLSREEVCCIGDDLIDLGLLKQAGYAVAVQNAVSDVKQAAHYITKRPGGRGAVREVADQILKSQGRWKSITELYYS